MDGSRNLASHEAPLNVMSQACPNPRGITYVMGEMPKVIDDLIMSYWFMSATWSEWLMTTDHVSGVSVIHREKYGIYLSNRTFVPSKRMSRKDKKKHAREQRRLLFDSTLGYPGEGPVDRHTDKFRKRAEKKERKAKIDANRDSKLNQHRKKKKTFDSTKGYPGEGPKPTIDAGVAFYECKTYACQDNHYHRNSNHANAARRVAAKDQGEGGRRPTPSDDKTEEQPEYIYCEKYGCNKKHYHTRILEQVQPLDPKNEPALLTARSSREDRKVLEVPSRGGKDESKVMLIVSQPAASASVGVSDGLTALTGSQAESKYPLDKPVPAPVRSTSPPVASDVKSPLPSVSDKKEKETKEASPPAPPSPPDDIADDKSVVPFDLPPSRPGPLASIPATGEMDVFVYFPDPAPPRGLGNRIRHWIYRTFMGATMYTADQTYLHETEDAVRLASFNGFWRALGVSWSVTGRDRAIFDVFQSCGFTRRQVMKISCELVHRVSRHPFFLSVPPLSNDSKFSRAYISTLQNAVSTVEDINVHVSIRNNTSVFLFNMAVFHHCSGAYRFLNRQVGDACFRKGRVGDVGRSTFRPRIA